MGVEEKFKALEIDGVPRFVVTGEVLFSGAAEPQVMVEAFRQAASPTSR
jgi:predicted DsbA family dithiol-disulfide isomerase